VHQGRLGSNHFGGYGLRREGAELCVGGRVRGGFGKNDSLCYSCGWLHYLFKGLEGLLCPTLHVPHVADFGICSICSVSERLLRYFVVIKLRK